MNEPGSGIMRKLLSRSAAIFFIRFCPAAATLAIGIAFAHRLPRELNGIYQQLWVYIAVLLSVAALGIPPLLFTHTPASIHSWLRNLQAKHVALFGFWICALSILLVAVFPSGYFPLSMLALLFVAQALTLLAESYLIVNQRFLITAAVSFFYSLLFCVPHYMFIRRSISFGMLVGSIACLNWLRTAILVIAAQRNFSRCKPEVTVTVMPRTVKKQWLQLGIYDLAQVAFRWIDKVMISFLVAPALFSIYFTGTTDVPFMAMMISAAGNGLLMQMATGSTEARDQIRLLNYSGAMLARVVFPIFFFLLFFRYELIVVMFSKAYEASVPLFAISIITILHRAYSYTSVMQHRNRVDLVIKGALIDLGIASVSAYPLYLWLGLKGVAFAFMISTYVQGVYYISQTARLLHCSPWALMPWKKWGVMLIVFGCAAIGLHELLIRFFGLKQTLLLGFIGTGAIISAALLPVIFTRKAHG